jgi:uridine kinase
MDPLRPIVDWITSLELGHPTRVGVDGRSAAGKTTLADSLAEVVQATTSRPVLRASIDDFPSPRPQIPLHARGVDAAILLRRGL